nr:MAG TPA: hypothetical protein [Caudoviricetes sp.]
MPHRLQTCSQGLHTFLCGYRCRRKFAADNSERTVSNRT